MTSDSMILIDEFHLTCSEDKDVLYVGVRATICLLETCPPWLTKWKETVQLRTREDCKQFF